MPVLTCKVFILYYYFDLSLTGIAKALGSTTDAVKSRLSRARSTIRRRMEEEGNETGT
ncbi:MAG: hypothetical protein HDQ87_01405 [Clostridia bacterium]|nr:hypothetical protein [Clostridia bacterium]